MNAQTLEQIEIKIAFLERANAELSDVVYRQHQELEALRTQMKALSDGLNSVRSEQAVLSAEEERPPHY